tara:strand:- start:1404 stop:1514 length:111 start_codon:yes stop_codon:yes gene_type:complete
MRGGGGENWGKGRAIVEVLEWWFGQAYAGTVVVDIL